MTVELEFNTLQSFSGIEQRGVKNKLFLKIYLLIITLNNYIYNTTKKKNTLTIDINRTKLNPPCLLMNENVFAIKSVSLNGTKI